MTVELELNELLKIRRNKLDELRGMGIDPFGQKFERLIMRVTSSKLMRTRRKKSLKRCPPK